MLWVVRFALYHHCHHCHCHYQKCQYRIHLLRCLRKSCDPGLYYRATCIFQEVLKIVEGTMLVVVVVVAVFGCFVAGERKRLPIGSQEIPQGNDYKYFLKNSLNKVGVIRRFNEFMK